MASNNEEKDLLGSLLSDQDELNVIEKNPKKKKLTLKSKAFDLNSNKQEQFSSNPSMISTTHVTQHQSRGFFQTQTSIEITNQFTHQQNLDSEKQTSIEQLQSFNSFEQLQKKTQRKHNTMQPYEFGVKNYENYLSDKQIEGRSALSQTDLEQICGNQHINRKLQNILEYGDLNVKFEIFQKVEMVCLKASKDMFGNYTVQKILETGEVEWKMRLFQVLKDNIMELSKNHYGCRVVQKLLEFIKDKVELQEYVLQSIIPQFQQLCNDEYGNYVIFYCLDVFSKQKCEFMLHYIEECLMFMCKQTFGCRIIQKILENYSIEYTQKMLDSLMTIAYQLCFSQFGNYVVQLILENGPMKERGKICQIIRDHFEQLSMNKFGSNTVEKFIGIFGPASIMMNLVSLSQNNEFMFVNLATNPFGNYVIKRVLISGDQSVQILRQLLKQYPELLIRIKSSEYGQRVGQILDAL